MVWHILKGNERLLPGRNKDPTPASGVYPSLYAGPLGIETTAVVVAFVGVHSIVCTVCAVFWGEMLLWFR